MGASEKDIAFDLYKLEYEKGAERYENIYKSTWTNFSYLTAISAGIIAFGSKGISPLWIGILASIPLLFWYVAVFEPANRYGDQVIDRLEELEKIFNQKYGGALSVDTSPPSAPASPPLEVGLQHFTWFNSRKKTQQGVPQKLRWPRVRYTIRGVAIILFLSLVIFALLAYRGVVDLNKPADTPTVAVEQKQKPLDVAISGINTAEMQRLSQENAQIRQDIEGLRRAVEALSNDLKRPQPVQQPTAP